MTRHMSISEARRKLFELAEYVAAQDGVVFIEHRDKRERVALVSEARLNYLEASLRELRRQVVKPFRLAGSIVSELSDDELEHALQELRSDAREQARAKIERF